MWRGETWTFTRPGVQNRDGDTVPQAPLSVPGCVFWTEGESADEFGRTTITSHGLLAVPRTGGVTEAHRPQSPAGEQFTITGRARWAGPHALTGHDFGYSVFRVKGVS